MNQKTITILPFLLFTFNFCFSQTLLDQKKQFTRADSLRGSLRTERTCYDVNFYELNIQIDTMKRSVSGSNKIVFSTLSDFTTLQIDLVESMKIVNILHLGNELKYRREFNAVFVEFPDSVKKGANEFILVNYYGVPQIAKRAPWDGGFSWSYDHNGNLWMGTTCEGLGASSWWPCKDYVGDEPDSMRIICTIPSGLKCITNGNEEWEAENENGTSTFAWKVSYPINNYNVSLNIGDYVHWSDTLVYFDKSKLALDYYVMPYNFEKSKKQFEQVKPMLSCYEKYLGKYPFMNDGYALVETPYLGMEHQSAIAYGNEYKIGYAGRDFSKIGLDFDYIIIHETAHEWWGNSVSCSDMADMWIHESFGTYTEAIYVECLYGYETALKYVNAKKPVIGNKAPVVGIYGVNEEGSGDMYGKGMLFLNSIRHIINDDAKWWTLIKRMCDTTFRMKNTNYEEVVNYFSSETKLNLAPVFEQYLKHTAIPVFEYSLKKTDGKEYELRYRWKTDVKNFEMPLFAYISEKKEVRLEATDAWQTKKLTLEKPADFKPDEEKIYFEAQKIN